jgi:hypothetical protein
MQHTVPHDLSVAQARSAADHALASYQERFPQYRPTVTWTEPTKATVEFHVTGMSFNGLFEIRPREISMELEVPFLLRPFKNKALEVIEGEIRAWVTKVKNGEIA